MLKPPQLVQNLTVYFSHKERWKEGLGLFIGVDNWNNFRRKQVTGSLYTNISTFLPSPCGCWTVKFWTIRKVLMYLPQLGEQLLTLLYVCPTHLIVTRSDPHLSSTLRYTICLSSHLGQDTPGHHFSKQMSTTLYQGII